MEITLAYVCSLDGFMTDRAGNAPTAWASPEDQQQFQDLVSKTGLVIMGANTYESHKHLFTQRPGLLRIVMTREPEKYRDEHVPLQLEFTSLSPVGLVATLSNRGFDRALMAGGPRLFTEFFRAKLISHLHITVEPVLFGEGISAARGIPAHINLELIDTEQLNTRGTLLVRYKVV